MITLGQSNRIIEAILSRGRELACRPLSVVVVEPGAAVKAFQKEDGSSMMRFEMAYGKAYAAVALGRSSSLVRVRAEERPLFMQYGQGEGRGGQTFTPILSFQIVVM